MKLGIAVIGIVLLGLASPRPPGIVSEAVDQRSTLVNRWQLQVPGEIRFEGDHSVAVGPMVTLSGEPPAPPGDPAGAFAHAPVAADMLTVASDMAEALPDASVVDLEAGRVFLPGKGWLSAEEIWAVYDEDPQALPLDLDLDALHRLPHPGDVSVGLGASASEQHVEPRDNAAL